MRITIIFSLALLLVGGCQWHSAGKASSLANAQAPMGASSTEVVHSTSTHFTDDDFAQHVELLKSNTQKKLASAGSRAAATDFSYVVQRPFVVVGDESKQAIQEHAEATVKWAVDRLKQDFFASDPKEILDIWLFKDTASYEKHAALLFGDTPTTPYGYYSAAHKALIMNIATGGGTLVHEIVHPFMEANFPACPPWLNEGIGSLYEQCGDANGHIHGFTNWRLPGLQRAIRSKQVPSFKELTALDSNAFYNEDKGVNYAQSRYLCYYLQEKGLLVKFYQEFQARQKEDRSGFKTLQHILGEADMDVFKTKWEKYVLSLRQGYEVTVEP
jgi:hypothetical protein